MASNLVKQIILDLPLYQALKEKSVEKFIALLDDFDSNLLEKFYNKDYQMTNDEIEKLVKTLLSISDKNSRNAVILSKHHLVFENTQNNEIKPIYETCFKENTLEETSIASNSLYFVTQQELKNPKYFRVVAQYDRDQILEIMLELNYSEGNMNLLCYDIASYQAQKCFDLMNKEFSKFFQNAYKRSIKNGNGKACIFLYENGINYKEQDIDSIISGNIEFLEHLINSGYKFKLEPSKIVKIYKKEVKNSLDDQHFFRALDFLIEKEKYSGVEILNASLENESEKMVEYYLRRVEPDEETLRFACFASSPEMIQKLVSMGTPGVENFLINALANSDEEVPLFLLKNYDMIVDSESFSEIIDKNNQELIFEAIKHNPVIDEWVIISILKLNNEDLLTFLSNSDKTINMWILNELMLDFDEYRDNFINGLDFLHEKIELTEEEKNKLLNDINDKDLRTIITNVVPIEK